MAIILRHHANVPVNVKSIAEQMGLVVRYVPMGPDLSGAIYHDPDDGFVIEIDSKDGPTRQRFTLAHEIAHYVLHRDLIKSGTKVIDNAMYRSDQLSEYEAQANRFAADIIMPKNRVRMAYGEEKNTAFLAKMFDVSEEAMKIRLGYLNR